MILPKITDSIIQQVQSIHTVGTKFNTANLYDIVNNIKGTVQVMQFKKYGKVNSAWTQQFTALKEDDLQESKKFIRFELPTPAVNLGSDNSGIVYSGSADGCQNFALVQTRGELNTFLNHRVTKKKPIILYSDAFLEVWNQPLIKELLIDYVPTNPLLLPTYNVDYDDYPLDAEGIAILKALVYESITNKQAVKPTDYDPGMTDKPTVIK